MAIWDTGATVSGITQKVVDSCGLSAIGWSEVTGVHGTQPSEAYLVNILLLNQVRVPNVRVTKGDFTNGDVLIGMDIISHDFAVTNYNGATCFSFRVPSMECIDFVTVVTAAAGSEPCRASADGKAAREGPLAPEREKPG